MVSKAPTVETFEVTPASVSEYVVEGSVFVRQDRSYRVRSVTVVGGKAQIEAEVINPHEEMARDRSRMNGARYKR
jgi:hypothetical protein